MSDTTDIRAGVMPSPIAGDESELAAWNALSRDEQVRRYRAVLSNSACDVISSDSMDDILAAAQQRVAAHRGG